MSKENAPVIIFVASLIAGIVMFALGDRTHFIALFALAAGQVMPSPFGASTSAQGPTPGLERVERGDRSEDVTR
jgi:hypothetical protein